MNATLFLVFLWTDGEIYSIIHNRQHHHQALTAERGMRSRLRPTRIAQMVSLFMPAMIFQVAIAMLIVGYLLYRSFA
jgi:hypothetical protein